MKKSLKLIWAFVSNKDCLIIPELNLVWFTYRYIDLNFKDQKKERRPSFSLIYN